MPVFTQIPFSPDAAAFQAQLRIRAGTRRAQEFADLLSESASVARPKAIFQENRIVRGRDHRVSIGDVVFTSELLHEQLSETVYPFAATCGHELAAYAATKGSRLHRFWLEYIQAAALNDAVRHLQEKIARPALSSLSPGSLPQWGLEQQTALFELLGANTATIGLQLTQNCLMRPLKSVSGIFYHSEDGFISCSRCTRINCPTRRSQPLEGGKPLEGPGCHSGSPRLTSLYEQSTYLK